MEIAFFKSAWEFTDGPLELFLERVAAAGFTGSELFLPFVEEPAERVRELHDAAGLELIAAIVTEGDTPEAHLAELERGVASAAALAPVKINAHAGRDIFEFEANARIFDRVVELSEEVGVPVLVETHRRRPTFAAGLTQRYLEAVSGLRLTADLSHWMVVHESDLSDQPSAVAAAIARSDHVHARVGHAEAPQVPHPEAPEWRDALERHLDLWRRVAERHRAEGAERMTVTPEFGPPPYAPTLPFTGVPVADVWEINLAMRRIVAAALAPESGTEGG